MDIKIGKAYATPMPYEKRGHLTRICKELALCIQKDMSHRLPGGYLFWSELPLKGHKTAKATLKRWGYLAQGLIFPDYIRSALLKSCLGHIGVLSRDEEDRKVYLWLLKNVYNGSEKRLYQDWDIRVKQKKR